MNLPLKHSFCFLQAYNKIMTSRTKRINRAMTTPITDAIETGSEIKRNYMNYEIIHNSILIFFWNQDARLCKRKYQVFANSMEKYSFEKKMVYLTKF